MYFGKVTVRRSLFQTSSVVGSVAALAIGLCALSVLAPTTSLSSHCQYPGLHHAVAASKHRFLRLTPLHFCLTLFQHLRWLLPSLATFAKGYARITWQAPLVVVQGRSGLFVATHIGRFAVSTFEIRCRLVSSLVAES
jgi:hypothetical protein